MLLYDLYSLYRKIQRKQFFGLSVLSVFSRKRHSRVKEADEGSDLWLLCGFSFLLCTREEEGVGSRAGRSFLLGHFSV